MQVKNTGFVEKETALKMLGVTEPDLKRYVKRGLVHSATVYTEADVERLAKGWFAVVERGLTSFENAVSGMEELGTLTIGLDEKQRTAFLRNRLLGAQRQATRFKRERKEPETIVTGTKRPRHTIRTPEQQRAIIAEYRSGKSLKALAQEHEVSAATISNWAKKYQVA